MRSNVPCAVCTIGRPESRSAASAGTPSCGISQPWLCTTWLRRASTTRRGSASRNSSPFAGRFSRQRRERVPKSGAGAHVVEDAARAHPVERLVEMIVRGREVDAPAARGQRAHERAGVVRDPPASPLLDHQQPARLRFVGRGGSAGAPYRRHAPLTARRRLGSLSAIASSNRPSISSATTGAAYLLSACARAAAPSRATRPGSSQIADEQRAQRLGVVLRARDPADLRRDHVRHALGAGRQAGAAGEHPEDHRARRTLGRAWAEHRHVERREHVGHLAAGRRDEVRALAQRHGQLAQFRFCFAVAAQQQVGARVLQLDHGADHDVVALLVVEARDAADHEGVLRDAQLVADAPAPLLAEADFIRPQDVRHDRSPSPGPRRPR